MTRMGFYNYTHKGYQIWLTDRLDSIEVEIFPDTKQKKLSDAQIRRRVKPVGHWTVNVPHGTHYMSDKNHQNLRKQCRLKAELWIDYHVGDMSTKAYNMRVKRFLK